MTRGLTAVSLKTLKINEVRYQGNLVRKERLELSRVTPLEPKSSASTNSATFAKGRTL